MSSSHALLGILAKQPNYGYILKKNYDFLYGKEKPMAFGQVYATLSRLVRDNKIVTEKFEQSGGPERKRYAITPQGRKDLESWLSSPEATSPNTQTVLFTKVVTAILLDKSPDIYLDTQRTAHFKQMQSLTQQRRQGNLAQSLRADYALFHLEADLRWIDLTTTRLKSLAEEIRSEQH
ncbi:MAG TPA: PadR family transcriptional regulator [Patescibacteria group bacterium]|nr:PadR family transcriptional regulator [Patescibacteria group bacterium]